MWVMELTPVTPSVAVIIMKNAKKEHNYNTYKINV